MGVTAERMRSVEERASGPKESEHRPVVLTPRDRELFVHLAIARYLSAEQIHRLLFAGATDSITRRRLCRLATGEHQYLRRLQYQTSADGPAVAWSLKPLGRLVARNLFSAIPELPRHGPPGSEFLEQVVRLNGLYVALAAAAKRQKLPFDRWPFRWLSSDSARLPWAEFDRESNSPANRLIRPDATLELPHEKRRAFIEAENGLHALALLRDGAPGRNATKLKIERYTRFVVTPISSLANETFYLQAFPDGWPAELLFIVPSPSRRDSITAYIARTWRPTNEAMQLMVRALTFDEAPADLCRAAQLPVESTPAPRTANAGAAITPEEIRAAYDFYNGAIAAIAAVRQFVKGKPQLTSNFPVPEYPPNHHVVKQICLRLAGSL